MTSINESSVSSGYDSDDYSSYSSLNDASFNKDASTSRAQTETDLCLQTADRIDLINRAELGDIVSKDNLEIALLIERYSLNSDSDIFLDEIVPILIKDNNKLLQNNKKLFENIDKKKEVHRLQKAENELRIFYLEGKIKTLERMLPGSNRLRASNFSTLDSHYPVYRKREQISRDVLKCAVRLEMNNIDPSSLFREMVSPLIQENRQLKSDRDRYLIDLDLKQQTEIRQKRTIDQLERKVDHLERQLNFVIKDSTSLKK